MNILQATEYARGIEYVFLVFLSEQTELIKIEHTELSKILFMTASLELKKIKTQTNNQNNLILVLSKLKCEFNMVFNLKMSQLKAMHASHIELSAVVNK